MRLKDRKVLITGAGSGIGRAMALLFAREGADVAVNDIDQGRIDAVVSEVQGLGRQAVGVKFDVTDFEAVRRGADQARKSLGHIDVLCSNAGIAPTVEFVNMSAEAFDKMIKIHLYGAFNCCKVVVDDMIKRRFGRIIVTSSMSGFAGDALLAHYSAAKAGQIALVKSLARELCSFGITVNAVAPGYTKTNIQADVSEEVLSKYMPPCGRIGDPEDQAWAAVYLASNEASFVTGHTLQVNGGSF
jgi:3-oxoacyl-[acyl-carrier protein] reductase